MPALVLLLVQGCETKADRAIAYAEDAEHHVVQLKSEVEDLEARLSDLESDLEGLRGQVADNESEIDSLRTDIDYR